MKAALSILTIALIISSCGNGSEKVKPEKRLITEVVYASGNLYPENEYKLVSNVPGYLNEVFVAEGDTVNIGQNLFLINLLNRNSEFEAARLALSIAQENASENSPVIAQLNQKLLAAKSKANTDSLNFRRFEALAAQEAISQADLDKATTQFNASKSEVNSIYEQITAQKRALKVELANAQNRYNQASNNIDDGLSKSNLKGKVYQVYKEKGEFVNINEPIALLGDLNDPIARLSINESDFSLIKLGQKVEIALDAYPENNFKAKVSKIYPVLNKVEQAFQVDAVFENSPPEGMYGLNLEANIIIREAKEVLSIPRSALLMNDSVMVNRNGEEMKVHVVTGVSDLRYVEIISGIDEGDEIIANN